MNRKYLQLLEKFSLTQFLTFITAIGTLITALVTFNMVEEMKLQRIVNDKPILKIKNLKNNTSNIIVKEVNKDRVFYWVGGDGRDFDNLSLINVGNGAALDIKIFWEIDPKIIKNYLKKDNQDITFVTYEEGKLTINNEIVNPKKIKGEQINVLLNKPKLCNRKLQDNKIL
ncbi:MAG: hypothetical protein U9Q33_00190 [Campylobacterota bacterium]|nr:hypothetical protein [Campylobacterota bacterium]